MVESFKRQEEHLKSLSQKPALQRKTGDEIAISNETLLALMQEVLARGASFHFKAKGWSMSPFIKNGDAITIAPLSSENLAVGKVAAFIHPGNGNLVVHRVVGRKNGMILFQGDNSFGRQDGLVQQMHILGCVTKVTRQGKPVYLGLGAERYLIAWLSRAGMLKRLRSVLRR